MGFFKNIFIKIVNLSSSFFKKELVSNSRPKKKDKEKKIIDKIILNQIKVREEIIKETEGNTNRIRKLSPEQEKLIKKKHNIQNKKAQKLSVFNMNELACEMELLDTNLELQKTLVFIPISIPSESISNLKKELTINKIPEISVLNVLLENRKIIKSLRDDDKTSIVQKRQDIFKFSLIELFKESERIKEMARIEVQKKEEKRLQNLKFDKAIKNAKRLINDYDFDKAEAELKKALSINNLRHKAVSNLKNEILKLRHHFEKQQAEFRIVFEKANNQILNKDYENALRNFNQSKLYGINSEEVNEKIRLVKGHIQYQKITEENFLKEKEAYISEIQNKRFIKAKRILTGIIEKFEDKVVDIESFQKLFDESKSNYNKIKIKYKKNIEKAEIYYLGEDLNEAIRIFKDCLNLNIDNEFCEKRIREIKHKKDLERRKQKLLVEKEKQEELQVAELNNFKNEREEILRLLRGHGITKFYHFTDESNLPSIRANNGLYSWIYCEQNNIVINRPGGDSLSKKLDCRYHLQNFVRLSFTNNHPMKYIAENDGRIRSSTNLEIDIETATFKTTLFSDINATANNHQKGYDLDFLKNNIKFHIVKQPEYRYLSPRDKPFYQAEIMVEEHIESKYIINL